MSAIATSVAEIKKITGLEPTPHKPAQERARFDLAQEVETLKAEIAQHEREAESLRLADQKALRIEVLDEAAFKKERVKVIESGLLVTTAKKA